MKRIEVDRKIKKAVLSRLFKHGYSVNTANEWMPKKFCGYIGATMPIQVFFNPWSIHIDRLFRCTLETGTAKEVNDYILSLLLQTDEYEAKDITEADFCDNTYMEVEKTFRGIGIIFYNKNKEITA